MEDSKNWHNSSVNTAYTQYPQQHLSQTLSNDKMDSKWLPIWNYFVNQVQWLNILPRFYSWNIFMEHLCSESMNAAWQVISSNNEQQSSLAGSEIQVCLSVKPQSKSLTKMNISSVSFQTNDDKFYQCLMYILQITITTATYHTHFLVYLRWLLQFHNNLWMSLIPNIMCTWYFPSVVW